MTDRIDERISEEIYKKNIKISPRRIVEYHKMWQELPKLQHVLPMDFPKTQNAEGVSKNISKKQLPKEVSNETPKIFDR